MEDESQMKLIGEFTPSTSHGKIKKMHWATDIA
jgi:hypothetical protein